MKEFLASLFPAQNLPEGAREGLPYWILWLLLCIIFLLVTFIFLRDKDLRRRLDSFFFGIRKKLTKLRLQAILKKEKQRYEVLLRELGRNAWKEKIPFQSDKNLKKELTRMEKAEADHKREISDIESEVASLRNNLGEISLRLGAQKQELESEATHIAKDITSIKQKEKDIEAQVIQQQAEYESAVSNLNQAKKNVYDINKDIKLSPEEKKARTINGDQEVERWEKEKTGIDEKIHTLITEKTELEKQAAKKKKTLEESQKKISQIEEEIGNQIREFQKEIKEWEKSREKAQGKIQHIEKQRTPLFYNLGKLINETRAENIELEIFYSRIDRSQKRQKKIKGQIQNLE